MNNLNSILIEGNMAKDPLVRHTPKGSTICTFTVASSRYYKGESGIEKEVSFIDIETWGQLAEACANKGRKGRSVRTVGRLRQDRWMGPDGKPHSRIVIVAEHVEFRPEFKKEAPAEIPSEEYTAEELESFAENGELAEEEAEEPVEAIA